MGISRWALACVLIACSCSAGDNTVDPSDLGLRDLLGLSPDVAAGWTSTQRASGRRVLLTSLRASTAAPDDADATAPQPIATAQNSAAAAASADGDMQALVEVLAARDTQRAAAGADPLAVVRVDRAPDHLTITPRVALHAADAIDGHPDQAAPASTQIMLDASWDASARWAHLPGRGLDVLTALAADAQHAGGPVIVVAAPRLTVIAAYLTDATPRLAVNPVLLAALEPDPDEAAGTAALLRRSTATPARAPQLVPSALPTMPAGLRSAPERTSVAGGNPYSFYGSFEECADAQRRRCAACLPGHTCEPVTDTSDGNAECAQLGDNSGRGYFLLCINLSLAISSVNDCTGSAAPTCARSTHAADSLATLDANTDFLDTSACAGALDGCLAKIYGAPDQPFPGLVDGGTVDAGAPQGPPPRTTSESCGNGCSNNNANCEASPTIDCTGPSCNNSLSCDAACASSNTQGGCNGDGNSCASDGNGNGGSCGSGGGDCGNGGGSGGGNGGSCGSDSGKSNGCGGDGCDKGSGSGSGGSTSSGGGGGCGGGSGGGGGCGGGSGGGGGCGGGSGGGGGCGGSSGGGSKCSASPGDAGPGVAVFMSLMWGLLPIPFAAATRRRAHCHPARLAPREPDCANRFAGQRTSGVNQRDGETTTADGASRLDEPSADGASRRDGETATDARDREEAL